MTHAAYINIPTKLAKPSLLKSVFPSLKILDCLNMQKTPKQAYGSTSISSSARSM